jgi:uncharacterized membrane protein
MARHSYLIRARLAILFIFSIAAVHAQTITTFDVPNATNTIPQANNLFGQIAGFYQDANFTVRSFLRQPNGSILVFNVLGSSDTKATSINDVGQITGYYNGKDNRSHGFLRRKNGTIITFDAPNSRFLPNPDLCEWQTIDTYPAAINLGGQITGIHRQRLVSLVEGEACAGIQFQGFLRNPGGTIVNFGISFAAGGVGAHSVAPHAINLPGQITGEYQSADVGRPVGGFIRQPNASITTFLDGNSRNGTFAKSINLFGQITGSHAGPPEIDTMFHGFLRQPNGNIITFDAAGSFDTEASAINDVGQITGYYLGTNNTWSGFLRKWNGVISSFSAPGASTGIQGGTFPLCINTFGQIVGYYQDVNLILHGFVRHP